MKASSASKEVETFSMKPHHDQTQTLLNMEKHESSPNAPVINYRQSCCRRKYIVYCIVAILVTVIIIVAVYSPYIIVKKLSSGKSFDVELKSTAYKMSAQRYDDRIQDCHGNSLKMSFPDVDYAMFGYNIIYGYPLETGHDPGLTRPIFVTDYSLKKFTSDCRYEVPKGYILVPDVACVTSFSSKVIQNSRQFEKSLAVNAKVSGGGWGVSFSASTSFQSKTSEMSSSESVFILSEAKCNYYFAMMDQVNPPELHPSFIKAIKSTDFTNDKAIFHLFDSFGTHFLKYVLFGARFVYQHKMSKSKFQEESSKDISVSIKASYSGLFSVGGGFGMSSNQKQAAMNFQESVETKTISIGAPLPAGGDTMKWASTVKETPVPVKYKLESIENLFTEVYMEGTGIPYDSLFPKVSSAKLRYCMYLFDKGAVDSCRDFNIDYVTFNGKFYPKEAGYKTMTASEDACINSCLEDPICVLAELHVEKNSNTRRFHCGLHKHGQTYSAISSKTFRSYIFTDAIKLLDSFVSIKNLYIDPQHAREKSSNSSEDDCQRKCQQDEFCAGYTFYRPLNRKENCYLFQEDRIKTLKTHTDTSSKNRPITKVMPRAEMKIK